MNKKNFYHHGINPVKRFTLTYANENRPYQIYQDLFYSLLIKLLGKKKHHNFKFINPLYSIDSSIVDLCLNLFPWAHFRRNKGGIKLHVKLDHSEYVPSLISITTAKVHEINAIRKMPVKGDVITSYKILQEHDIEKYQNIEYNHTIVMTGYKTGTECEYKLRIIKSFNLETCKTIVLLTNNYQWCTKTIVEVSKDRWQIEIFIKSIKQNLKIKSLFGASKNAILAQIWIAMISFLLLKYLADSASEVLTVGTLMAVIPIVLFLKKDICLWLNKPRLTGISNILKKCRLELEL